MKILPQFQNTFFLCNLVGYLKGYSRKLYLLFGTVHLKGKLPYFDSWNLIYLLMASFVGYFYYGCNDCFHAFGATIVDFDAVSVKDLVEAVVLRKMLVK